jgi:hypothetical protein
MPSCVMTGEAHRNSLDAYVRAALQMHGFVFDAAEIAEIVLQFSRIESIATIVLEQPLPFASAPAPVFRP